jgi:hypothetical protein
VEEKGIGCWKRAMAVVMLALLAVVVACRPVVAAGSPSPWARAGVDAARDKGLVIAQADGNYQANITRQLFCALVVNMVEKALGHSVPPAAVNPFQDTADPAVLKAYQLGVVKGVTATRFAPQQAITREQMAVMMMQGARKLDQLKGTSFAVLSGPVTVSFADLDQVSGWALQAVQEANQLGIMLGVGGNRINPKGNTTVEQSILLVQRLYDGIMSHAQEGGQPGGDDNVPNSPPVTIINPAVFSVPEQTPLLLRASQLATDADGDALEIVEVSGGTVGSCSLTSDGGCRYVSRDISADVTDSLSVVVSDGRASLAVNVRVQVLASAPSGNAPVPLANPVVLAVAERVPLAIQASRLAADGDGDALKVVRVNGQPTSTPTTWGTAVVTAEGDCLYTSRDIAADAIDDFPVTVSDGVHEAHVNVRVQVAAGLELAPLRPTVAAVSVTGTPAMHETLRAGMVTYLGGIPSPAPVLSYQWMAASSPAGPFLELPGATGATYTASRDDVGRYLKLKVTASGSAGGWAVSEVKGPVGFGFAGGDGSAANPFQIATARQFMLLDDVSVPTMDHYFRLVSDITLGPNQYVRPAFFGVLDGNGHTVRIDLDLAGEVQNVGLFASTPNVNLPVRIENLAVAGRIHAPAASCVGGVIGYNGATIAGCRSTVTIVGKDRVGGVAGTNLGRLERCAATGEHVFGNSAVGGLVGLNLHDGIRMDDGVVLDCYARSTVHGTGRVGGLVGHNRDVVRSCYAAGRVDGEGDRGGLVGYNEGGWVVDSFYDREVSGRNDTGRGEPRTTVQMQTPITFQAWDYNHVWLVLAGRYPELR